ncbi:10A19I.15 [Zea mays]|nr:10A19I.15 [Zea mays]ONM25001.1 10A19I.15 [Zea mays]
MADMVSEVAGQGARPALRWTAVMSGFVLRRFVDLIGNGVKTDKGFKEIHLNSVAKNVSEFCGQEVTGQQVYNHLRKWRSRWVKVCKLKDISGALWDEDNFVISLEEGHYAAYIKGKTVDKGTPGESNDNKPNLGKRKRFMTDEDVAVFNGMKQAVSDVAAAVRESIHAEAAPGIYNAVINCPGFSREALMYALNHMMEHKATSLVFLDMTPDDRDLWLKTFLAKHYHN